MASPSELRGGLLGELSPATGTPSFVGRNLEPSMCAMGMGVPQYTPLDGPPSEAPPMVQVYTCSASRLDHRIGPTTAGRARTTPAVDDSTFFDSSWIGSRLN